MPKGLRTATLTNSTVQLTSDQDPSVGLKAALAILALRKEGELDADLARRVGLSPQLIHNYKKGTHGASLEAIVTVCRTAHIDPAALLGLESVRSLLETDAQRKLKAIREIVEMSPVLQDEEPTGIPGFSPAEARKEASRRAEANRIREGVAREREGLAETTPRTERHRVPKPKLRGIA